MVAGGVVKAKGAKGGRAKAVRDEVVPAADKAVKRADNATQAAAGATVVGLLASGSIALIANATRN